MKRISAFVMVLLCLALCGCGSTAESIDETETERITTTEVTWCTTIPIDLLEEWEQKKTAEETESDSVTDYNHDTAVSEMQNVESMDIEQLPTERTEQIKNILENN